MAERRCAIPVVGHATAAARAPVRTGIFDGAARVPAPALDRLGDERS